MMGRDEREENNLEFRKKRRLIAFFSLLLRRQTAA
jgi:hypothetical protein